MTREIRGSSWCGLVHDQVLAGDAVVVRVDRRHQAGITPQAAGRFVGDLGVVPRAVGRAGFRCRVGCRAGCRDLDRGAGDIGGGASVTGGGFGGGGASGRW